VFWPAEVGHSIKRRKFVSVSDKQSVGRLCCYPNLFYLASLSAVSTWKAIHANKRTFGSLAFSLPQSICIEGRYDLCKLSLFVWRASTMWLFFIANFFCLRLALQIEGPKLVTLLNQTTPMYSIWPQSNLSFHHQVHLASKQESCRVFFAWLAQRWRHIIWLKLAMRTMLQIVLLWDTIAGFTQIRSLLAGYNGGVLQLIEAAQHQPL
jgi:hypothetical protein